MRTVVQVYHEHGGVNITRADPLATSPASVKISSNKQTCTTLELELIILDSVGKYKI